MSGKMAMSSDFLGAFANLPAAQQKAVRSLISKFEKNPRAPTLHYEGIHQAADRRMRSVRVDQDYRAIILSPNKGDTHVLLWAAKHDDAYNWARRHKCEINPETGVLQIYSPSTAVTPPPAVAAQSQPPDSVGPYSGLRDRELVRLGVPREMIPEVREIRDEAELEVSKARLPQEAYEGLYYYLGGVSYEEIIREREAPPDEPVDTDDFTKALLRDGSRARFVLINDQHELSEMLDSPLEKWRTFLHPSQRRIVERDWNGPVRVLGAAGTGKTVVAMHRARWLAGRCNDDGRVLFVTYNKNLATDIRQNLCDLCDGGQFRRIEVINLDAWVQRFLRSREYKFQISYERPKEAKEAWNHALDCRPAELGLPKGFYEAEWEQVVQANGITTEAAYRRVPRTGRGTPLNRPGRVKVWRVFEEYRFQLAERGIKEVDDVYRDAVDLLRTTAADLRYSSVVVDEAQDLSAQAFRLIRAIAPKGPNDLFIAGDCHQRIYGRKTVLGKCGINIRGRSRKLQLNYRTTEQTRAWAASLLEGCAIDDLDGGSDNNQRIRSLTQGPEPLLRHFDNLEQQVGAVVEYLRSLEEKGEQPKDVCLVARTRKELQAIQRLMDDAGMESEQIDKAGDDREKGGVRIATMHRIKGLEFERMVLASVNAGLVPLALGMKEASDETERVAFETQERALVYVAASRAKKELLVLSYGKPSSFLPDASATA